MECSRDSCRLEVRERPAKSSAGPQLLAYQRHSIGERRTSIVVPSHSTDGARAFLRHFSVSEERDQGEKAQQCRSGAPDSLLRPLPLRLEAQALAHLLEGGFHLPPPYKPRDDLLGLRAEIGAQ